VNNGLAAEVDPSLPRMNGPLCGDRRVRRVVAFKASGTLKTELDEDLDERGSGD